MSSFSFDFAGLVSSFHSRVTPQYGLDDFFALLKDLFRKSIINHIFLWLSRTKKLPPFHPVNFHRFKKEKNLAKDRKLW